MSKKIESIKWKHCPYCDYDVCNKYKPRHDIKDLECCKCGWNPNVAADRLNKITRKMKVSSTK